MLLVASSAEECVICVLLVSVFKCCGFSVMFLVYVTLCVCLCLVFITSKSIQARDTSTSVVQYSLLHLKALCIYTGQFGWASMI